MASDNSKIMTVGDIYKANGLDADIVQSALHNGGESLAQSISNAFQQKSGITPDQIKSPEQSQLFYQTAAEVIKNGMNNQSSQAPVQNIAPSSDNSSLQAAQPQPAETQPQKQEAPWNGEHLNFGVQNDNGLSKVISSLETPDDLQAQLQQERAAKQAKIDEENQRQIAENAKIEAKNQQIRDYIDQQNKLAGWNKYQYLPDSDTAEKFKKDWNAEHASTGIGGDLMRNLVSGTLDIGDAAAGIYKALGGSTPNYDQWSNDAHEKLDAELTPEGQAAQKKAWDTLGADSAWRDPRSYLGSVSRSLPSTALLMIPGGIAGQAAWRSAEAVGLSLARKEALSIASKPGFDAAAEKLLGTEAYQTAAKAGADKLRDSFAEKYVAQQAPEIYKAATKKAERAVFWGSAAANGAFTTGDTANGITQALNQVPDDTWRNSDMVKGLEASGMSFKDAVAKVRQDATIQGSLISGVLGGVFGGSGDRVLAKIITHKAEEGAAKGFLRRAGSAALHGIAAEGSEEAAQEASQQAAQNYAVSQADNNQSLMEGVPNAALGGLAAGGLMGAGFGVMGAMSRGPLQKAVENSAAAKANASAQAAQETVNSAESAAAQNANIPEEAPALNSQNIAQAAPNFENSLVNAEAAAQIQQPEMPQASAPEGNQQAAAQPEGGNRVFVDDGKNAPWEGQPLDWKNGKREVLDKSGEVHEIDSLHIHDARDGESLSDFSEAERTKNRRANYAAHNQPSGENPASSAKSGKQEAQPVSDTAAEQNNSASETPKNSESAVPETSAIAADEAAYKNNIPKRSETVSLADIEKKSGAAHPSLQPGARVIADAPNIDAKRQGGTITEISGSSAEDSQHKPSAKVKLDSGETKEFPLKSLYISRNSAAKANAQPDLTRNIGAYKGKMLPQGARTLKFPDENYAALYDLGVNNLAEADIPAAKKRLAKAFGVDEANITKMAADYAQKGAKYAADTKDNLDIAMRPLSEAELKRNGAKTNQKNKTGASQQPETAGKTAAAPAEPEKSATGTEKTAEKTEKSLSDAEKNATKEEKKEGAALSDEIERAIEDESYIPKVANGIKESFPAEAAPHSLVYRDAKGRIYYNDVFTPEDLNIDAKTYQFKESDARGVTDALKGITLYDHKAADNIIVHLRDGKPYVADGHQRTNLAKQLSAEKGQKIPMRAWVLSDKEGFTAKDARIEAAVKNVQQRTSSIKDTASILREAPERFKEDKALARSGPHMRKASAIANLEDKVWSDFVNGVINENVAAAIGTLPKNQQQPVADALIAKGKGDIGTDIEAATVVRQLSAQGFTEHTQTDMFGEFKGLRPLGIERGEIISDAERKLKSMASGLKTVNKSESILNKVEGNVLNKEGNKELAEESRNLAETLQHIVDVNPFINEKLNDLAKELSQQDRVSARQRMRAECANKFANFMQAQIKKYGINKLLVGVQEKDAENGAAQRESSAEKDNSSVAKSGDKSENASGRADREIPISDELQRAQSTRAESPVSSDEPAKHSRKNRRGEIGKESNGETEGRESGTAQNNAGEPSAETESARNVKREAFGKHWDAMPASKRQKLLDAAAIKGRNSSQLWGSFSETIKGKLREAAKAAESAPEKIGKGFFDKPGMEDLKAEAEDIMAQLRKKLFNTNQLNSGLDPEVVMLAAKLATVYIRGGVRKFAQFVKEAHKTAPDIVDKLGQENMEGAYLYVRRSKEFKSIRSEMDNEDVLDNTDYDSLINSAKSEANSENSSETEERKTESGQESQTPSEQSENSPEKLSDFQSKLDKIIADEKLNPEKANKFMQLAVNNSELPLSGTALRDIMPPLSLRSHGAPESPYTLAKNRLVPKLQRLLDETRAANAKAQGKSEDDNTHRSGNLPDSSASGGGALERVSAEEIRGSEKERAAKAGASGRSAEHGERGEGSEGDGLFSAGRLGNGEREIHVPAGGAGSERTRSARTDGERKVAEKEAAARPASGIPAESQAAHFTVSKDIAEEAENTGKKTKFRNNIEAVKVLETLADEERPATAQEQQVLARWSGWGGLREAFPREDGSIASGWAREAKLLKDILSPQEYEAARDSVRNAHYTPAEVVQAMWQIADRLGYKGGNLLEPSVGSGVFIGMMPPQHREASKITGVELDPITGNIAKNLYPGANIQVTGFQNITVPNGHFDMVIGNPPFGSETIYDAGRKDLSGLSIHNYFFAKSADGLRPGGVGAFVITNSFLDGKNEEARRYLADKADLIGAIRLPNDAFAKNAGTQVTTDIVLLHRRADGEKPGNQNWVQTSDYTDKEGRIVPLNRYFMEHPDMMLGDFGAYGNMYGREGYPALISRANENLSEALQKAIEKLPENLMPEPELNIKPAPDIPETDAKTAPVNSFFIDKKDGAIWQRLPDELGEPRAEKVIYDVNGRGNKTAQERMSGMIGIRDIYTKLRAAQLDPNASDSKIESLRKQLNTVYDKFVAKSGPLSASPNERVFRDDPTYFQLISLESKFDKGITPAQSRLTGEAIRKPSAQKSAIFFKRTQQPYQEPTSAKTAKDALAISLTKSGGVDFDLMSRLLSGQDKDSIIEELGDRIFKNPDGSYETSDAYLSGDVRRKLAEAERAYESGDKSMEANITALKTVQPQDITSDNIAVRPGAGWLPPDDVSDFLRHISGTDRPVAVYNPYLAKWTIKDFISRSEAESQWATTKAKLQKILESALNDKTPTVYKNIRDENGAEKSIVDAEATTAAVAKVEQIHREFSKWVWSDTDREKRLTKLYNDMFNTVALRHYDGSHLNLPGKVSDDIISLRPHQKNFVWRALQNGRNLADHQVGAGKTFAAIAATMERRRMGAARKPLIIVPNHLVEQWAADFLRLYPGANILVATKKDFLKGGRQAFLGRMANGDYDAVIMAHSSFGKIPVSAEFESRFITAELEKLRRAIAQERADTKKEKSRSVSQMVKMETAYKERLKKLADASAKDTGLTFMDLGVDALTVDEAHEFKNLAYTSSMQNIAGLPVPQGSKKAFDLYMKSRYLLEQTRGKNFDFLTGTPISNSLAEAWTMMRYLDEGWLKEKGLDNLDAWTRQFAQVQKNWELSPNGEFKQKSRLAKFNNMPELMQRYLSFADVITSDDIKAQLAEEGKTLPIPKVKGEKPENIVVERSPYQAEFIGMPDKDGNYPPHSLIARFDNLGGKPQSGKDNALSLTMEAAKVALDPRIIDPRAPDYPDSKVNRAAENIKNIYDESSPQKGTQLIFCDLSTPKKAVAAERKRIEKLIEAADNGDDDAQTALDNMSDADKASLDAKFSVYDDLKYKLIASGIPENEIAFIHDANTDEQKGILFGKVRSGQIRILIGSTSKMGAGTNVQNRIVALHHLDAPWRPSDLEQREGRAIRQGNELYEKDPDNFSVGIYRYATKQTLDARRWQVLESKARFIQQFRKGDLKAREVEDISGEAANSAEMKAAASGDPRLLELQDLNQKIQRLEIERKAHASEAYAVRRKIENYKEGIEKRARQLPDLEKDAKSAERMPDKLSITVNGQEYTKLREAGAAILAQGVKMLQAQANEKTAGQLGPFSLKLVRSPGDKLNSSFDAVLKGAADHYISIGSIYEPGIDNTIGLRVSRKIKTLPKVLETAQASQESDVKTLASLEKQSKEDWSGEEELKKAQARRDEVILDINNSKKANNQSVSAEGEAAAAEKISGDDLRKEIENSEFGDFARALEENGKLKFGKGAKSEQGRTENGVIHLSEAPKGNAAAVLLHEAFHQGAEPLLGGKSWNRLMKGLSSLLSQFRNGKGEAAHFFKRAQERLENAENRFGPLSDEMRAEEFGAYAIEEYEKAPRAAKSWVRDILGNIKAWLKRRLGIQAGKITPEELRSLAVAALKDQAGSLVKPERPGRRYSADENGSSANNNEMSEEEIQEAQQKARHEAERAANQYLDLRRQTWNSEISGKQAADFGEKWDNLTELQRENKLKSLGMSPEDSLYWRGQSWDEINSNPVPDNPRESLILNRPYDERALAERGRGAENPSQAQTDINGEKFERPYLAGDKIMELAQNIKPGEIREIGNAGNLKLELIGRKSGERNVADLRLSAPDGAQEQLKLGDLSENDPERGQKIGARLQKIANSMLAEDKPEPQNAAPAAALQLQSMIDGNKKDIAAETARKKPNAERIAGLRKQIDSWQNNLNLLQARMRAEEKENAARAAEKGSPRQSAADAQAQKDAEAIAALRAGKRTPAEQKKIDALTQHTDAISNAPMPDSKSARQSFMKLARAELRRIHDIQEMNYNRLDHAKKNNNAQAISDAYHAINAYAGAADRLRLKLKKVEDAYDGHERSYKKFENDIAKKEQERARDERIDLWKAQSAGKKNERAAQERADAIENQVKEAAKARRDALNQRRDMGDLGEKLSGADKDSTVRRFINRIKNVATDWTPKFLKTIPLNYFVEMARPNMTAVAAYMEAKRAMDTYRSQKHEKMNEIALHWQRFGKDAKAAQILSDLMHDSTLEGVDPTKTIDEQNDERIRRPIADSTNYMNKHIEPSVYERIKSAYDSLPEEGQAIYREVRDAYAAQAEETEEIILTNIAQQHQFVEERNEMRFRRELDALEKANLPDKERNQQVKALKAAYFREKNNAYKDMKSRLLGLEQKFNQTRERGPYFPLKRYGNYFVTVRDGAGNVISFSRRETASERDALAKEMRAAFPEASIEVGVMEDRRSRTRMIDPRMMAELQDILGENFVKDETAHQIMDALWQRHLETLPDLSMRKSFMHRKGTAGFEADALRDFGNQMFHAYHQMGRMKYELAMHEMLFHTATEQARFADDPTKGTMLVNEMKSRHDWVMNPTGSDWANKATSAGFVWYLGATPAASIVNMMQTLQMGIPILGAHFNSMTRAAAQTMRAGIQAFRRGGLAKANLTEDEKRALSRFYESGLIDRTQSYELAGLAEKGMNYGVKDKAWASVMKAISYPFHRAEVWNREATAMAAYRMARMQGESHEKAIEMAHELTWKTHFDYSNSARPPIMQNDFAKVALVFKNYQLNMLYRLGRDLHQSFFGLTPIARRQARRELAGMMGMFTLFAGVAGVPGYSLMMGLMGSIFGDDDNPYDYQLRFKQGVYEMLGPELGGLVMNGVPGHMLGINLTDRTGMADLLFRSDDKDEAADEAMKDWFIQNIGGATFGMALQLVKGMQMIKEGNTARGVEMMLPNKALRDAMKSYRYNQEGLMSARGDEILSRKDFDAWDIAAQALGFTPAKVSESWERNIALKNAEQRIVDERRELINRYAMAVKMKDKDGQREMMEKIRDFNKTPRNRAIRITPETLQRTLQTRKTQDKKRQEGVLIQNTALGKQLRKDLIAPIYR